MSNTSENKSILKKDGVSYLVPFILITFCFALWGFANDITNPMVKAFSKIFRMSVTDGTLVQVAFYGGYFAMAFPAAMFIRKYTYKAGVMMGLGLYAVGALAFFPAKLTGSYYPFLLAYFVMTCGLSFLETSCNPYILSMGTEEMATRRLNLAQAFNPIGSLMGMFVAMNFIQNQLHPMDTAERAQLSQAEFEAIRDADLTILIDHWYCNLGNASHHSYVQDAEECGSVSFHKFSSYIETFVCRETLSLWSSGTVLLCRCTDYVLDFHYPVWYSSVHGTRNGGTGSRSLVTEI